MAEATAKPKKKYDLGTGRRKTAVARVRVCEGTGKVTINGKELDAFFTEIKDRNAVLAPLLLTEMRTRLDVIVKVAGGGFSGQSGAICHGLARALVELFGKQASAETPASEGAETASGGMVSKLKHSGFLTRDARMKERKKYGRKGARRSFQFSKR